MSGHRAGARRWWKRIAAAVVALLAVALVAGVAVVNLEHFEFEPVLSGSMRPGIQPGDLAVLRSGPVDSLHKGEVIAYLPPDQSIPVMHRIISITSAGVLTKGDANSAPDPWGRVKPQESSVEHLVAVIPRVGFLIDVKRQLLAVAGGVLMLVLAVGLWSWGRESRTQNVDATTDGFESSEPQLLTQPKEK